MYNVTQAQESANNIVEFEQFPVGIIENVKLGGATFDTNQFGNKELTVLYTYTVNGMETILRVRETEPQHKPNETPEQFNKRCDNQLSRMFQIIHCFKKPEEVLITGNDFNSVFGTIAAMLNGADFRGQLVRLKATYNDKGFVTTTRFHNSRFIEPMTVSKENSKIKLSKNELIVRPAPIVADEPLTF